MGKPLWATTERQNYLVNIFLASRGFCIYGHTACSNPAHYYELYIERVISSWKADDRLQREAEWEAESKRLHSLGERHYPLRGQFSAISQEIFHDRQPQFYLLGMGISGLTFRAFAQVRLSNTYLNLYVDIKDTLGKVGKVKRRKAVRYGKPLPLELQGEINKVCKLALDHYLEH